MGTHVPPNALKVDKHVARIHLFLSRWRRLSLDIDMHKIIQDQNDQNPNPTLQCSDKMNLHAVHQEGSSKAGVLDDLQLMAPGIIHIPVLCRMPRHC